MAQFDTYAPAFFENLKNAEKKHFWFEIRRKWIFDKLKKFIPPPAKVLEIGCGSGNVSSFLVEKGYDVVGCEFYSEAFQNAWPGFTKIQGDAKNLPFSDNSFDIVCLFDVIEHFQDDFMPIKEAFRVCKKNGIIAIAVPAREELWSSIDKLSFHKKRYTKKSLTQTISKIHVDLLLLEYMFMSLYLPMKLLRRKNAELSSQFEINRYLNFVLKSLFNLEKIISNYINLPIGTSLIALVKKQSSGT